MKHARKFALDMLKEMTSHTIIDAGVKPAVVTDILIDEETLEKHQVLMDARHSTDEIRKGSMPSSMTHKRIMSKDMRDSFLSVFRDDNSADWTQKQWKEWDKFWNGRTLITTVLDEQSFYMMTHEQIVNHLMDSVGNLSFYEPILTDEGFEMKVPVKGGKKSTFFVLMMQAWITTFIKSSREYETISQMPLDDREMAVIFIDGETPDRVREAVFGHNYETTYAPVYIVEYSDTGGKPHTGFEGEECTCKGKHKLGSWKPAQLSEEKSTSEKDTITW